MGQNSRAVTKYDLINRIKERLKLQQGLTLLEVILALALTGISAAVLGASFIQGTHTREQLNGRVTAQIIGAGKLAELIAGSELANSGTFPEPYHKFNWTAREETEENGIHVIRLTVEWSRNNTLSQKTLVGYVEPKE
ncbi:MAG: type II secretion system protein [Firmicutes bacterium]|nr:type II secretion system protein [Bacillota bacterium]